MRERIAAARAVFDRSSKMFLTCSEVHAQDMVVYFVLVAGMVILFAASAEFYCLLKDIYLGRLAWSSGICHATPPLLAC